MFEPNQFTPWAFSLTAGTNSHFQFLQLCRKSLFLYSTFSVPEVFLIFNLKIDDTHISSRCTKNEANISWIQSLTSCARKSVQQWWGGRAVVSCSPAHTPIRLNSKRVCLIHNHVNIQNTSTVRIKNAEDIFGLSHANSCSFVPLSYIMLFTDEELWLLSFMCIQCQQLACIQCVCLLARVWNQSIVQPFLCPFRCRHCYDVKKMRVCLCVCSPRFPRSPLQSSTWHQSPVVAL